MTAQKRPKFRPKFRPKSDVPKRILFVPDTHVPYHDVDKWNLMLRAARVFKPHTIVVLGDFADFYCISQHSKSPERGRLLKDEIAEVNSCLTQLDALGAQRKIYISGNHEDRYDRYISEHAPEFYDMMSLKDLFKLGKRGWQWVDYGDAIQIGKLWVTHDHGKAGKYAHYQAQAAFEGNIVMGHTHRLGYTVVGNALGHAHVAAMFGWLGSVDEVQDYMYRIAANRDWAHGFGIGYQLPDDTVHVVPIPIVKDTVVIEGKVIK